MDSWFKVKEIDNDTFIISEYRHRKETHCYLILGEESAILIEMLFIAHQMKKS